MLSLGEGANNQSHRHRMKLSHFAVLSNYATTGHKLQGKSLERLIIAEWSKKQNWAYVVLSRVRTLSGVYLCKPLPEDISFVPDPEYLDMMTRMRTTIKARPFAPTGISLGS